MPGFNQFFQQAGNDLLQQDDQLRQGLSQELAKLQMQQQQLQRVLQVAGVLGEDVSALAPMMEELQLKQMQLMQNMQAKTQLPSSASTPQMNIPAPRMPNAAF